MSAEQSEPELWLRITELAKREGVAKSVISEKVKAWEAEEGNLVRVRREGRSKLVELGTFLRAKQSTGNAAKEAGPQTREKQIAAYLKELELRQRLGQLVPVADVEDAALKAGQAIVTVIDRISG